MLRQRLPVGALLSLAVLLVVPLIVGNLTAVEARGRVLDDWNDTPIANAQIRVGSRIVTTDGNGEFVATGLPRGVVLNVRATTYVSQDVPADHTGDIRLVPATLNLTVNDSQTHVGVNSPEVHQKDGTLIRTGTEAGDIAIAHPGKDVSFIVCAPKYSSKEVHTTLTHLEVSLDPNAAGACPTPPPPSPSPSESPAPSPSVAPAPSPTPTP